MFWYYFVLILSPDVKPVAIISFLQMQLVSPKNNLRQALLAEDGIDHIRSAREGTPNLVSEVEA